jgi:DNA polymerase-3 subunit epsilon
MIAIIDIETSNFLNKGGKIVEVGIVGLDLEKGKIYKLFHSVCREEGMTAKDRNAWIFKNSDLTIEEVREAPLFTDIKPAIQKVIDKCEACTAYNRSFDFDFLRDRGVVIKNEYPCPMLVAMNEVKLPQKNKWVKEPYKWPTVEEAWRHLFPDKPYVEAHRGLDDAKHEAIIVLKLNQLGLM